jgi:uncharacterized protein YbjT (DUF2867 family)|tara:strand:+ start:135 stop:1100 length:966 start_codon:yes stop_codon:yes gene_type:complete
MKPKEILVFGASGQLGRHLLRKLARNNFKVTAVTRNIHQKGYILKSQANAGWIDIVEIEKFDYEKLNNIFENKNICINLVGILNEKHRNSFDNIHYLFPKTLAELSKKNNLDQFIHVSALGIEDAIDSKYASSKIKGENAIKDILERYIILKPSLIYSVDDKFTTMLMSMMKILPIFPIYYEGKTVFYPIHVSDMCEIIENIIIKNLKKISIECIGPEKITFKEILKKLLSSLEVKRLLIPTPLLIAKGFASIFETTMKKPLLTKDQLTLLKYDNSPSGNYKTNLDLHLNSSLKIFHEEVSKYSYMWKDGGEFSKPKVNKS